MRVKELNNKVAHVVWSPLTVCPWSYIAAGTASEQLDASFSTKSHLELLKLDVTNPSGDLEVSGAVESPSRFAKLIWSDYDALGAKHIIIGGCEDSKIYLHDYEKILANGRSVVQVLDKHGPGPVSALDVNPFQKNLLASGKYNL